MNKTDFVQLLDVSESEEHVFCSLLHRENFRRQLFGGQVLAQALSAAQKTVTDDRHIHSLHAYFLRAGTSSDVVNYQVECIRDGKSMSNRCVRAMQQGELIFTMHLSFHIKEPGYEHQQHIDLCTLPDPDQLLAANPGLLNEPKDELLMPFVIVPVQEASLSSSDCHEAKAGFWIKTRDKLPLNSRLQASALAFASDLGLLATTLLPHPTSLFSGELAVASVDHALWFHKAELDLNQWHFCQMQSPWAGNARGFATASIYDSSGNLVVNSAQEGLIRPNSLAS